MGDENKYLLVRTRGSDDYTVRGRSVSSSLLGLSTQRKTNCEMCFLLKYKPDIPWSVSSSQCLSIRTNTKTSHPSIPCVTGGITHVLYGFWEKKKQITKWRVPRGRKQWRETASTSFRNMHSKLSPFECAMRHVKAWDKLHFLSYIFFSFALS